MTERWRSAGGFDSRGEFFGDSKPDNRLVAEQPEPVSNESAAIWPKVIEDMHARDQTGRAKYGTPLQPFNGRDALVDMYQEALDLVVYARQAIDEREAIKNSAARVQRGMDFVKHSLNMQGQCFDWMDDVSELVNMILKHR